MPEGWNGGDFMQNDPLMWGRVAGAKHLHSSDDAEKNLYRDEKEISPKDSHRRYQGRVEVPKQSFWENVKHLFKKK